MSDYNLLNFINEFNVLVEEVNQKDENLLPYRFSIEQLYFSICDLLSELGYSIMSKSTYEELFDIHMLDTNYASKEIQILAFVLQLVNIDIYQENILSKYKLICSDHTYIYNILYTNRKFEIGDPCTQHFSFIYDQEFIKKIFLDKNIITDKV